MSNKNHGKTSRTQITDIPAVGAELSSEQLRLVSGGAGALSRGPVRCGTTTYCPNSCTASRFGPDTDNYACDSD